jgi:16S rRNA (guanine966-N2)-methyltransferase
MRVIAGALRGRSIRPPNARDFRPTTDRVKETVFNILSHRMEMEACLVCDLFAGSGSLGIEALSRGAAHVVFVENGRAALPILRRNLSELGLERVTEVLAEAAERFLRSTARTFDLMLADPPYAFEGHVAMLETISARGLLRTGGMVVMEHSAKMLLTAPAEWTTVTMRDFGTTAVTILREDERTQETAP